MKVGFDGGIKLEFHDAKVISDSGFLAYRNLDDALGLFDFFSATFHDNRNGRNIQHAMPTLLRQSIYSRLAGLVNFKEYILCFHTYSRGCFQWKITLLRNMKVVILIHKQECFEINLPINLKWGMSVDIAKGELEILRVFIRG